MSFELRNLQSAAVDSVKKRAGDAWNSWSDDEKNLVMECTKDAMLIGLIASTNEPLYKQEKAQIDAQLANIKVASGATAAETIWKVIGDLLSVAVSIILKAI